MLNEYSIENLDRLLGDNVCVRRMKAPEIDLGNIAGAFGSIETFTASAEALPSGVLMSSPGCEITRAEVFMAGPKCSVLTAGDWVHIPSMLADGEKIPLIPSNDGFEYLVFREADCLNRIAFVDVPVAFISE